MVSPRAKAWLQLCRLPNVFTALADPLAGALAVGARWSDAPRILAVTVVSGLLYTFGMVLNDWHDYKKDLKERPHRPLPSKQIPRWRALLAAIMLMGAGLGIATPLGAEVGAVAVLLVTSIIAYDVLLKHVPIAPIIMGLCRALNLLLGMMAVMPERWMLQGSMRSYLALCMGVYVCGITAFARRETQVRQGYWLLIGATLTWLGVLGLGLLPTWFKDRGFRGDGYVWAAILLGLLCYRMTAALFSPRPELIQPAVKTGILGIILFDASIVAFTHGLPISLPLLLLLIPAVWLGKWIYST